MAVDPLIVFEDKHFYVEQCRTVPIPGYLILHPLRPVRSLADLDADALEDFGKVLAAGMDAIQRIVQPERIYVLRFGEEVEAIHCHLFPRTAVMRALYHTHHPSSPFSGARLFDWVRQPAVLSELVFPQAVDTITAAIRNAMVHRKFS